jgi:hypothetical protein
MAASMEVPIFDLLWAFSYARTTVPQGIDFLTQVRRQCSFMGKFANSLPKGSRSHQRFIAV